MLSGRAAVRNGPSSLRSVSFQRRNWHGLGSYATRPNDAAAWKDLRSRESAVESAVTRYGSDGGLSIDWSEWNKSIQHKDIVSSMKSFHDEQIALIKQLQKEDSYKLVHDDDKGWDLYDEAVTSCSSSVHRSFNIVDNGAKALWISYHNPLPWQIHPTEWLDSDLYWQAYFEKHLLRHSTTGVAIDPESEEWHAMTKHHVDMDTAAWNDRSDTPANNQLMVQLPSWEYYDIHRRALLEHGMYYLLRTGGDMRFFPEIPPPNWLTHIEELRWKFISVAQRRRAHFQLTKGARTQALDLQPLDSAHDGDIYHQKWIARETRLYENAAARLMGHYCLFCDPYVGVQTRSGLDRVVMRYPSCKVYKLDDDNVNSLFVLPNGDDMTFPHPKEAFHNQLDHLTMTGRRFNPAYATIMDIYTDILSLRPSPWFKTDDESVAQAFMRRLPADDSLRPVYKAYISEMNDAFKTKKEITLQEACTAMDTIEEKYMKECEVYTQLQHSLNEEITTEGKSEVEQLIKLHGSGQLQSLMDAGAAVVVDASVQTGQSVFVTDAQSVIDSISDFQEARDRSADAITSQKTSLDAKKATKTSSPSS